MNTTGRTIVYVTQHEDMGSPAAAINSTRRILAMEKAGNRVLAVFHRPDRIFGDSITILKYLKRASCLVIRIDGSGLLDKFTLLKLLKWNLKIIWEIHAFPDENYDMNYGRPPFLIRLKNTVKRGVLSHLVHTTVFVSEELRQYASSKMTLRNSLVIPNFIVSGEYTRKKGVKSPVLTALEKRGAFVVLWGGLAGLRWQAVDVVEAVAKRTFSVDPSILFIIIGSDSWHPVTWHKNILIMDSLPRDTYLNFVRISSVCLALYHAPVHAAFYFSPLKILDYMMLEKPVIATRQPPIEKMIRDNQTGFLVSNDPKVITEKILILKRNRGLTRTMGQRAKKFIESNFTLREAVNRYKQAFAR